LYLFFLSPTGSESELVSEKFIVDELFIATVFVCALAAGITQIFVILKVSCY
jgi:hypothetical protein